MTQRCWPRAELSHPGLPIILQHSRGGTSSKFRDIVEDWMVSFSPSGTWYRSRGYFGHLAYRTSLIFESHRAGYILSSSRCCSGSVIGLGISSIFGSSGNRGSGGGAVSYIFI